MTNLIYSAIASLDGYIADEQGRFDWSMPDEEVHAFINDLQRQIGTYLFGRRMYEVMTAWEGLSNDAGLPAVEHDFATMWDTTDKVVYSRTLETASSARTRIERNFAPDEVRRMKDETDRDLAVGGSELAAEALRAGLVDECHLFLSPIALGCGKRFLADGIRIELELLDERRFGNGVVYLRYGVGKSDR
ncbi:dihydrofolate reductase family protein [Crystallibacter degradans]|uniref:dihydrofolate reductase family protein n=1 Tax=Crystallibacter degradans TaxID=2726743 RepID=UPI0014732DCC|nr:dihydrofolate reductase family protein [Arthrobacter sp. SF27]NMR28742.1 deaminase [Arthrobacter sp. SF27]